MLAYSAPHAFAVWITGLPASGKSTIAAKLSAQLADRGIDTAILESDELRKIFTPHPRYAPEERDLFYREIAYVGTLLTRHGVPVIFDATAHRRLYRDWARQQIPKFLEVYIACPLASCVARDPKGIYRRASAGTAQTVPGIQTEYEIPENPDIVLAGENETPEEAARKVIATLQDRGYLQQAKIISEC